VQLWKHTGSKTRHTASLLAKPTPLNINHSSDRFSMFNKERDITRAELAFPLHESSAGIKRPQ
jgi:hypothetical protein